LPDISNARVARRSAIEYTQISSRGTVSAAEKDERDSAAVG
jgi:hypothetical protein